MEVVLRPASDDFLTEVAFPAFELGVVEAAAGLELLRDRLQDERMQVLLELLFDRGVEGSFFGLEEDRWFEAVYRLLFHEWAKGDQGWLAGSEYVGFACDWEQALHLCLMLEQSDYPYADPKASRKYREEVAGAPAGLGELSQLVCGCWEPAPSFPPDQVLSTHSQLSCYRPGELAVADWSWRPMHVVNAWAAQLPNKLSRLLGRESRRLAPVEAPETHEILDYWLGRTDLPPTLAVSFSGLGPTAHSWIHDLGALARLIRAAAAKGQGLTAIITRPSRSMFDGAPGEEA